MIFGMSRTRRLSLLIALCLGISSTGGAWSSAGVWAGEPPLTVERLVTALMEDREVTVRFLEERRLEFLTEPIVFEGTLTFNPPDYMERLVLRPRWEKIVVEGGLLTVQANKRDLPTRLLLSDLPALDAMITTLRSLFAGDPDALQRLHEATLTADGDDWSLKLLPRAAAWREAVQTVTVEGTEHSVRSITVTEAGGDSSTIIILGKS